MRVQCFVHSFSSLVCMRNFTWMSSEVSHRNLLFTAPLSFHLCFTGSAQVLHFWWPFFISQRIHCKLSTWIRFVLFLINRIFLSNRIAFHFYASWSYQQWFNGWQRKREEWKAKSEGALGMRSIRNPNTDFISASVLCLFCHLFWFYSFFYLPKKINRKMHIRVTCYKLFCHPFPLSAYLYLSIHFNIILNAKWVNFLQPST